MINSYKDYLEYLESDRISLNRQKTLRSLLLDDIWKFQRVMRKLEWLRNCKKNRMSKLFTAYRYRRISRKLGFSIPMNVFGPGLSIAHAGTIVVNPRTRVGANCRLHVCVNIGTKAGKSYDVPTIGDNCYIAPGVKIFGKIEIGPNTVIGANAVVNSSFPEGNVTIGGIPARILSRENSEGLLIKGYRRDQGCVEKQ